jgi:hypothetical protein
LRAAPAERLATSSVPRLGGSGYFLLGFLPFPGREVCGSSFLIPGRTRSYLPLVGIAWLSICPGAALGTTITVVGVVGTAGSAGAPGEAALEAAPEL